MPIGESVSVVRIQLYGLVIVFYGPLILAQAIVGRAPTVIGQSEAWVQFYGLVVILYRPLRLA